MKQRPILMSTPMATAVANGSKIQTRRLVKLPNWSTKDWEDFTAIDDYVSIICEDTGCEAELACPYGKVGDVLWVRETWNLFHGEVVYRADIDNDPTAQKVARSMFGGWKPSLFMPFEACRLFLEITDVRVERLQEISEADAIAEGVASTPVTNGKGDDSVRYQDYLKRYDIEHPLHQWTYTAIHSYQTLWQKINGRDSWQANPFVWVLNFKQIGKPQTP